MMPKAIDITGVRFGSLVAIKNVDGRRRRNGTLVRRWVCQCDCGNQTTVDQCALTGGSTSSCGCRNTCNRRGADSPSWRGGVRKKNGYVFLRDVDHPNSVCGYVREHVKVMAEILGRKLEKNETVHHKNGNRSDNRPENLELWVVSQPSGQRASDLVQYAKGILERYGKFDSQK